MKTIRMEEMTAPQIKAAIANGYKTAVIGVGSTEQHGPHLPTMTDTRIGDEVAYRVALKLNNALQARTIPVGVSDHHLAFGGTISLRPETLKMIICDYVNSLVQCGFTRIIFLPSHGGNFPTVEQAIKELQIKYPETKIIGYTDLFGFAHLLNSVSNMFGVTDDESGAHAGENETSIMLLLENKLVLKEKYECGYLGPTGEKEIRIILEKGMPALTKNGVLGDPRKASLDKGEVYLERLSSFLIQEIKDQMVY
ncbi:MAG: creatininase family protein [Bacteroidota bacterium]